MASVTISAPPVTKSNVTQLVIRSYEGLAYREVSTAKPRDCTEDEVPVLDLSGIDGSLESRKEIADQLLSAAEKTGFFYIQNHGVHAKVIDRCLSKAKGFFRLPKEQKERAILQSNKSNYGYQPVSSRQVNPASSKDQKETFNFHYEPRFDPLHKQSLSSVPQSLIDHLPKDPHIWRDVGLPGWPEDIMSYYESMLALARRMIKLVALALELPDTYFDELSTYPGGDMGINFYPGHGDTPVADLEEVGLGAHTDLQVLTLLYQSDDDKGLQVLNNAGEWVYAPPKDGTFVVNIGDFLMRMTNDRLKSTVHRVIHHGRTDRYSMPFFFGFNFAAKLGVLPCCVSEENPAKYEPATIGEVSLPIPQMRTSNLFWKAD
ncbi:oxidoreductase-like protein [Thozetella sp. PMI_491]|nr:oxidoreductase-like protein [Thozetella sp. PMI_491]